MLLLEGKGGTATSSDERLGIPSFSDARLECTPCPETGNEEAVERELLVSKAVASLARGMSGELPWVEVALLLLLDLFPIRILSVEDTLLNPCTFCCRRCALAFEHEHLLLLCAVAKFVSSM
jgi:hypothetical protein